MWGDPHISVGRRVERPIQCRKVAEASQAEHTLLPSPRRAPRSGHNVPRFSRKKPRKLRKSRILHGRGDLMNWFLLFEFERSMSRFQAGPSGSSQKSRPAKWSFHASTDDPPFQRYPRNPFVGVASPSGSSRLEIAGTSERRRSLRSGAPDRLLDGRRSDRCRTECMRSLR
jgi:hypothetical protein